MLDKYSKDQELVSLPIFANLEAISSVSKITSKENLNSSMRGLMHNYCFRSGVAQNIDRVASALFRKRDISIYKALMEH